MPSWSEIITDVNSYSNVAEKLNEKREGYLNQICSITGRNVIAYYSGWLKAPDAPHVSIDEQKRIVAQVEALELEITKARTVIESAASEKQAILDKYL